MISEKESQDSGDATVQADEALTSVFNNLLGTR
jgi:hypothetical protein